MDGFVGINNSLPINQRVDLKMILELVYNLMIEYPEIIDTP